MNIESNKAVTLSYTLKNDEGTILDKADANEPFIYLHGNHGIIPGLEKALEGKAKGDNFTVSIEPAEAYGEYNEEMKQEVPKEMFGDMDDSQLFPGAQFHAETNQGMQVISIAAVGEETVTIDGNHPMAGLNLNFEGTVDDIRDATEEEIAHGHVHAAGGCGHDHSHDEGGCS